MRRNLTKDVYKFSFSFTETIAGELKANGIYDAKKTIEKEFGYAPDFRILKIIAPDGESLEYIEAVDDPEKHIWTMDDSFTS